jgi:ubiquinone/menaquinone biosynthesis C-methylase UbiE
MPLFRRRNDRDNRAEQPVASSATSARPRRNEDEDWRSFDSAGQVYARVFAPHFARIADDLVHLLKVRPGQRILDVGTGTGVGARAAERATGPGGTVVGIDPSLGMLRVANRDGGRYAAATSIDLPFRDATFDHLLANFVIAFFPNYQTALFDLLRVLKPGGRLAVSAWAAGDDLDEFRKAWRDVAEEFAEREILRDATERAIPWEERFGDRNSLKETLHDAGVRDIWIEVREYRFEMSRDDWLAGREATPLGRFLRQMLGEELWGVFLRRVGEVFAERFPPMLNDFREVNLAVGHKP